MDEQIKEAFRKSTATNTEASYQAYLHILEETEKEVNWAYEVWDELLEDLDQGDNHQRTRAVQYLSNLTAKSDPEQRMLEDFPEVWQVAYDDKTVTARHSLQAMWKIGLAGEEEKDMVMNYMTDRFENCMEEKNYTLIRSDILENIKQLFDHTGAKSIEKTALELITSVDDEKYKKKYTKARKPLSYERSNSTWTKTFRLRDLLSRYERT